MAAEREQGRWRFKWVTEWDEVWSPDFLERWERLCRNSPTAHVFFEPPLVRAWVESRREIGPLEPRFLAGRHEGGALVFLPLVLMTAGWKGARLRSLVPAGFSEYDYHDPVVVPPPEGGKTPAFWDDLVRETVARWQREYDVLRIDGLRSVSSGGHHVFRPGDVSLRIDLNGFAPGEDCLSRLSRSLRGDIRRQIRRLEEQGEVGLKIFGKEEIDEALSRLPEMLRRHHRRWPRSYHLPGFHRRLVREGIAGGVVHLSELTAGGDTVSWHLGMEHRSRFYWYLPVYKGEFQSFSPGKIHLYFALKEAVTRDFTVFDLLRGDEEYKRQWSPETVRLHELRVGSGGLFSMARRLLAERVKPLLKKAAGK